MTDLHLPIYCLDVEFWDHDCFGMEKPMRSLQAVLQCMYQHEDKYSETISNVMTQYKLFKDKKEAYNNRDAIKHQAVVLTNLKYWIQCSSSAPQLSWHGTWRTC